MEKGEIEKSNLVLDSSIVIKWFCQEDNTEKALQIREKFSNGDINISFPDLIIYEISNALRYNKTLTEKDIEDSINSIMDLNAEIIVPTKELTKLAISIAKRHNMTVYDSYYLALAKELNFSLLTADEELYNKAKDLEVVNLLKDYVV